MKKSSWSELFNDVDHGKRLIEFVVLCLEGKNGFIRYYDIAEALNVDEETVKRYRKQLNGIGITIHSYKKTGVSISRELLSDDTIQKLIQLYQGYITIVRTLLCADNPRQIPNQDNLDSDKTITGECEICNLVMIQRAIERKEKLLIECEVGGVREFHRVTPLYINQEAIPWRFVANEERKIEQYSSTHLRNVKRATRTGSN